MFQQIIDPNSWDLMILPPGQKSVPVPYLASSLSEHDARVSPDGHWVAFLSNALGGNQAFVDAYPKTGRLLRISTQAASSVRWRAGGRQLLVMNAEGTQLSTYDLQSAGSDLKIAATRTIEWPWKGRTLSWDTVSNSPRLLALVIEAPTTASLTVAAGWTKSLKR